MQQPSGQQPNQPSSPQVSVSDLLLANLGPMIKQLDRLEDKTKDLATRRDLEALRKELVARDSLEPQLAALKNQIERVDENRIDDKKAIEKRIDELADDQMSRQDRLWIRLSQVASFIAIVVSLFEFISHLRLTP